MAFKNYKEKLKLNKNRRCANKLSELLFKMFHMDRKL